MKLGVSGAITCHEVPGQVVEAAIEAFFAEARRTADNVSRVY